MGIGKFGPEGESSDWVEFDRFYWKDPRNGFVWRVIAQARVRESLADGFAKSGEDRVTLVFDAPQVQHRVPWSEPVPLRKLPDEDFQDLLSEAKRLSFQ